MKKRTSLLVALSLLVCLGAFSLSGCATDNSGSTTSADDEYSAVEDATLTTRTITLPGVYFSDSQDEATVIAAIEDHGYTDVISNGDNTYTFTLSTADYNKLVDGLKETTIETLNAIPNSEDYPNITAVDYDENFQHITLTFSTSELSFGDSFISLTAGILPVLYQKVAGLEVQTTITLVDQTGNVLSERVLPDDLETEEESR